MVRCVPRGRDGRWAFLFVVVVAANGLVQDARAQAPEPVPDEPPTFELPEVVAPGKRPQPVTSTPASVTAITREEIERSGARTVADALRMVPELTVRSVGGVGEAAQPSIRGSTPAQVLVLLDGIPLNNVALGQADLSTISIDAVDRIEILRGPFAAIYGSGALGGVINIVTTRARGGRGYARTGGFGQRSATMVVSSSNGVPWHLTITSDTTAGHRANSDYSGTTVAARLGPPEATRMLVHYYSVDLGTPGDITSPTPSDRQAERRTLLQLQGGGADRTRPWGRMYYISDYLTFFSATFGPATYYSTLLGGELQRVWELSPQRQLTAGLEAQRQALDATVSGSPVVADAVVGAGYVQYDAAVSQRTLASLGLRLDSHSVYGATFNPRAGIVHQLSDTTRLRAAVGRTFRGPTFLEPLSFPGCPGNPALQPETAWSAEVGVERRVGGWTLAATAFGTDAIDLIVGGCPAQNVGMASIRGLSAEAKRGIASRLSVAANVTLMQATDQTTGEPLHRVPGVTTNVVLHYQVAPSSALSLLAAYVGPRPDVQVDPNPPFASTTVQMPGYVDLRLRYRLTAPRGWMLTIGVDNVLNQQYEAIKGFPAPGRTVFISAATEF